MFETEIRIFYEDTDCGGVVYYANYLKYFERARTLLLMEKGVDPAAWAKNGVMFAVAEAEVAYKSPAVYGDVLLARAAILEMKSSSLSIGYEILRKDNGKIIATGKTRMACVSGEMRPQRIPDEIRERLI